MISPRSALAYKPFGSRFLHSVQGGVDEHLDEAAGRQDVARQLAVGGERGDEGGQGDETGVGHQRGHFAHPADILLAVFVAEAQVLVEAVADIVAVQQIGVVALMGENLLQGAGEGGFSRSAQAGEPDHQGLLVLLIGAPIPVDGVGVPDDVVAHDFVSEDGFLAVDKE